MAARPRVVAIAGGTGTGKTTLCARIADHVGRDAVTLLHQDHYYRDRSDLPPAERDALNFDHPDAIEFDRLLADLDRLRTGQPIDRPTYDFVTHTRTGQTTPLQPAPLILVEGILILHPPALRDRLDLAIYLYADPQAMIRRRTERDIAQRGRAAKEEESKPFEKHVLPMHQKFVEPTRTHADLALDTTVPTPALVRAALARIEPLLRSAP